MKLTNRQQRQEQKALLLARYARHGRKPLERKLAGFAKLSLIVSVLLAVSSQWPAPFAVSAPVDTVKLNPAQTWPAVSMHQLPPVLKGFTPAAQLQHLAAHYNIPYRPDANLQRKVVTTLVRDLAARHGVPEAIALAVSGYESGGWKMWNLNVVSNANFAEDGSLHSTDWGVMQLNDLAHPQAFPRGAEEVVYNVDYGLGLLAGLHKVYQGSLNLGFGDWDATLVAYNLGHAPADDEMQTASHYLKGLRRFLCDQAVPYHPRYTIQPGDSLQSIAAVQLGDSARWPAILLTNAGSISPHQLQVGQEILLPQF